jgi:hypothetical protein
VMGAVSAVVLLATVVACGAPARRAAFDVCKDQGTVGLLVNSRSPSSVRQH